MTSAAGVVLVGIASSDADSPVHTIGAATHFIAAGFGICAIKNYPSLLTGIVILTATASLSQIHKDFGVMERIAAYSIVFWLVASGVRHLKPWS